MTWKTRRTTLFAHAVILVLLGATAALGQTTSFVYQGRLTDGGTAANGNYDLQFALWTSLAGGTQVGSTQNLNTVAVSNGVFTVSLDFGANAFPGASRFLEISARPTGSSSFTTLTPRQPITSTPYAVRSLNAATADSIPASGVPSGSGNYIQNSSSPQTSNFNITGIGTANIVNATTQFSLNGQRILSNQGTNNLFAGFLAGANNQGSSNSFFGTLAGRANTTGSLNSFFGNLAGSSHTTGNNNAFFGTSAGSSNTTGSLNAFFGDSAGSSNTTGERNTAIGRAAQVGFDLTNATAIGANARVDVSNSLVLGSVIPATNVGIGLTAPQRKMHIHGTGSGGIGIGDLLVTGTGTVGSAITLEATGGDGRSFSWISTANSASSGGGRLAAFDVTAGAYRMIIDSIGRVGIGTTAPDQILSVSGNASKSSGGTSWAVFSDERLKNIKGSFTPGLKVLLQLQPLRYEYKPNNPLDLPWGSDEVGFSAQAVQQVLPEAVSRSQQGYLQLHSDPILWTMLNAIKEQQALIETQRQQIAGLRRLVCRSHRRAPACK